MQKNMEKKIALIFYFFIFLILFRGCQVIFNRVIDYLFDVANPEEDYFYDVYWYFQGDGADSGGSVPEEYYFRIYNTIYQYSVATHELISLYRFEEEDDGIDDYAISDDFIFFITGANTGPKTPAAKLWKYDRTANTCKLFAEVSKSTRLALYGDYVFYGVFDFNVCPIDGNPEEDSVSLLAQFPEDVPVQKMRDIVYQGWHIRRERNSASNQILFIKDSESDRVIWDREAVWLDVNGELIHVASNFHTLYRFWYQRENEQEKRSFDCLNGYGSSFSADTTIFRHRTGVEDGKIICLITEVDYIPNHNQVPQNRVRRDVLFEIDPETDSSRVIFATEGSKTRIIGCRGGTLYLLEDDIIYRESLEDGSREEVFDLRDGSVDLYRRDGRHTDIQFIMWGDNLIVSPPYGTKGMFTIPLSDQAEDSQEERN